MKPKVSIIIPCFNAESYIEAGLRSLTNQNYKNLEIIVVDDFSTDNSELVVREFASLDPRVCFFKNKSKGANVARELGVAHSKGAYIAFMDADDAWSESAFSILVEQALRANLDLVCCNMLSVNGESSNKLFSYHHLNKIIYCEKDWVTSLEVPPSACAKLFKAELLKDVPLDNVPFAQDWNISYKALVMAKTIIFIDNPLYIYIRREGSTSSIRKKVFLNDILSAEKSIAGIESRQIKFGMSPAKGFFLSALKIRFYLDLAIRSCWIDLASERNYLCDYIGSKIPIRLLAKSFLSAPTSLERRKTVILFLFVYLPPARYFLRRFYLGRHRA